MNGSWRIASAIAVCLVARTAHADENAPAPALSDQTEETSARAVQLFKRASENYRNGRFAEAVAQLLEVQRIRPEPALHYNLARAYEGLGQWRDAIESYSAYLREEPGVVDRGAIERRLETLRENVRRTAERDAVDARAGDRSSHTNIGPIVVAGLGLAAAATGIVLGVEAGRQEDLATGDVDQRESRRKLSVASDEATAANVAFAAAGTLIVAGVVWWLVGRTTNGQAARAPMRSVWTF